MSPNRKRETTRIALWALAAMTLIAVWGQIAWLQQG
jgi:hypothetical protein